MSSYAASLAALGDAIILDAKNAMLPLISPAREEVFSARERLAVYAGGYRIRLVNVTKADYPATAQLLGEPAFTQAVEKYVQHTPSQQWDLNLYSIGFAAQLEESPARALAALESAIVEVFWLPDSEALPPAALASLSPETLAAQSFRLRTASRLLQLDYTVHHHLTAFRAGNPLPALEKKTEYLCVVRHNNEVQRHVLEEAEYHLLCSLRDGLNFGDALEKTAGAERMDGEMLVGKLPGYLERWLGSGFFAS